MAPGWDREMSKRKKVAQLAGVSEATVSRVLNGVGSVREETKQKVIAAAKRIGYTPNSIARSFVLQRSENLGVVMPVLPKVHLFSAYYYSEILSGIGYVAERRGYSLLVQMYPAEETPRYETAFQKRKIDGCIILGSKHEERDLQSMQILHESGYPFCIVGGRTKLPYSEVDADHVAGSKAAIRHLLASGHRRIVFVNGPLEYSNSYDRLHGVKQALAEGGIEQASTKFLQGNYSRKSGYELAGEVYEARHSFDAVFAANDRMAIGLMQGLKERGMFAGTDYALVGYDDSEASRVIDPPLTTVHVPFFEMGRLAAEKLIDRIDSASESMGPLEPFKEMLSTKLVVRESSRYI